MKCESCGLAEAGCEFEVTSKDGSTMQWPAQLCWDCLEKRISEVLGGKIDLQKLIPDEIKGEKDT